MKNIEEIDRNMAVCTRVEDADVCWYDVRQEPFSLHGLYRPCAEGPFRRLPEKVAHATNEGVEQLALNTAGGRVRFATDSPYVAIHAEMSNVCRMEHMAFTGIFGFDLYCRRDGEECFLGTFRPPVDLEGGYE